MRVILFSFLLLILSSCGTTNIYVDGPQKSQYRIYVDGKEKGTTHTTLVKRGFPQKALIQVKSPDEKVLFTETIKRRFVFNLWTVVDLLYPYLLITNFEYHREYRFTVPPAEGLKSSWDENPKSAWD
ncbi:MAG: hypothetical protein ACOVO9_04345 [Bacteroidia bacterium]